MKKLHHLISKVNSYAILVVPEWPSVELLIAIEKRLSNTSVVFNIVAFADETSRIARWLTEINERANVFILPSASIDYYSRGNSTFLYADGVVWDFTGRHINDNNEISKYLTIASDMIISGVKVLNDGNEVPSPIASLNYSFVYEPGEEFRITAVSTFTISDLKTLFILQAGSLKVYDFHADHFQIKIPDGVSEIYVTLMLGSWSVCLFSKCELKPKITIQLSSPLGRMEMIPAENYPFIVTDDISSLSFCYATNHCERLSVSVSTLDERKILPFINLATQGTYRIEDSNIGVSTYSYYAIEFKALSRTQRITIAKLLIYCVPQEYDFEEPIPIHSNFNFIHFIENPQMIEVYAAVPPSKRTNDNPIKVKDERKQRGQPIDSFLQRISKALRANNKKT